MWSSRDYIYSCNLSPLERINDLEIPHMALEVELKQSRVSEIIELQVTFNKNVCI